MSGVEPDGSPAISPEREGVAGLEVSWSIDGQGAVLNLGSEEWDEAGGMSVATVSELRDPAQIYSHLDRVDPVLAQMFAEAYERWESEQGRHLTASDVELSHGRAQPGSTGMGPSSPGVRAQRIGVPELPQAVVSSPQQPLSPEHRAAQPPPDSGALNSHRLSEDVSAVRAQRAHESLQREVERIDPRGDPALSLEGRIQQLPPQWRAELEGFLHREWVRDEQERRATVVLGRNGNVWTLGQEEADKAREVFGQGVERFGAAAGSLGGALLMSAGVAAGIDDHQTLMNLAALGSTFEEFAQARAARGTGTVLPEPRARRPSMKNNAGSKAVKGKRPPKAVRVGAVLARPIRILPVFVKGLELSKEEVRLIERCAEVFREEMRAVRHMPNLDIASGRAHSATQARVLKEFGDRVIIEPHTGVTAPGDKRGDVQAYQLDGRGVMVELKRTAFVRRDGTLVTKGRDALEPGQAVQTDAFEVLHHQLATPVVVIESEGDIFASAKMFDPETGGGWMQIGGRR